MDRIHESLPLIVASNLATVNTTPLTTAWVDMKDYHEIIATLCLGDMAAETIDFKIEQATDGSGTGAKDLKAATQLAAHASNNDHRQVQISAHLEKLDGNGGFRFVRGRAITGGVTGGAAVVLLHGRPRYKPGTQAATVLQTAIT